MDPDFLKVLIFSSGGSALGTLIKSLTQPEHHFRRWLVQSFVSLVVGTFAGGMAWEWFHFGVWGASACAASGAYLSEQIVRALQAYGRSLEHDPRLPFDRKKKEDDTDVQS